MGDVPARCLDVGAARAPHEADDAIQGKTCLLELLDGRRRRPPKQTPNDPICLELAGDVIHLTLDLEAGWLDREQANHVSLLLRNCLDHRNAVTASGIVEVEVRNLRSFPRTVVLEIFHDNASLGPVRGRSRENVRPGLAVDGVPAPGT